MNTTCSFELVIGSSVLQHRDNPPRMTLTGVTRLPVRARVVTILNVS
jgi:hypothetical protein